MLPRALGGGTPVSRNARADLRSSRRHTVTAKSDGVGRANMLLTVTFVTGDFASIKAGDYLTTVTGTVAANP